MARRGRWSSRTEFPTPRALPTRATGSLPRSCGLRPVRSSSERVKGREPTWATRWDSADHLTTIVVPEAKDGSRFTADLVLRDGTYRIGGLDGEFHVLGYTNALRFLHAMASPTWRRPSRTSGISGVVKGVRWVTVHRDSPSIEPVYQNGEQPLPGHWAVSP